MSDKEEFVKLDNKYYKLVIENRNNIAKLTQITNFNLEEIKMLKEIYLGGEGK